MNILKVISLFISKQLFVISISCMSIMYANTAPNSTSNSKENAKNSQKINEKNTLNSDTESSEDNFHEIMSTKNGCAASCCSGDNVAQRVNKSKKQKSKKRFGWFNRPK